MLETVKKTIAEYGLIKSGQSVVAGISGGADSVALLHCLLALSRTEGFSVFAAHLHHGIRGESADADQLFTQELCEQWGVPFYTEKADVPGLAALKKQTLEQAGREVRYAFLEKARARFGADRIAVAHHMDDQAESILLHLIRGSGLSGLAGMYPKRDRIIRPLLRLRRSEIESYLEKEGIAFCTDETNLEAEGARNRLRLDIIPYIEQNLNKAIVPTLCSMAELLRRDESYLASLAREALDSSRRNRGYDRFALNKLELPIKTRALRMALAEHGILKDIERVHIEALCDLLEAKTGTRLELPGITARTSYNLISFGRITFPRVDDTPLVLPGITHTPYGDFEAVFVDGNGYTKDKNTACMDADSLSCLELTVRSRRPGDRFYPLGAPGRRKLKEFFIDKKVPRSARDRPLLCAGDEVLFIPGCGISERVKLSAGSTKALWVTFNEINDDGR